MNFLVCNCGSSSLKVALFDPNLACLFRTSVGRLSPENPDKPTKPWREAMKKILLELDAAGLRVDASAHRFVHGGLRFPGAVLVEPETRRVLGQMVNLAPLHHPFALTVLDAIEEAFPGAPHHAVFDSNAFFDLPMRARQIGLPKALCEEHGLRRYGFHGFSHEPAAKEVARRLPTDSQDGLVITCHLGNGCSAAAWRGGEALDCSMGYSPLSGMLMATRCGEIDANLVLDLVQSFDGDTERVRRLLQSEGGLLGRCGESDFRDIQAMANAGNDSALEAIELFVYRVQKSVTALLPASCQPLVALAFTGGIGEHQASVRERICHGLGSLNIVLDDVANQNHATLISAARSEIQIFVVPAEEERTIAETLLANRPSLPLASGRP